MPAAHRPRDLALLDALGAFPPVAFEGSVFRVVRAGRDPLEGHASGGRWDPGTFDVLYTALEPDGAIAEMHFHLSRQPVFPSKISFALHEIGISTRRTLRLADMEALIPLGVEAERYRDLLYERTQAIGDAAQFLGLDGLIAPNARWPCLNLVVFTERIAPDDLEVRRSEPVDWQAWRTRSGRARS